jgi:hypothetical protein
MPSHVAKTCPTVEIYQLIFGVQVPIGQDTSELLIKSLDVKGAIRVGANLFEDRTHETAISGEPGDEGLARIKNASNRTLPACLVF